MGFIVRALKEKKIPGQKKKICFKGIAVIRRPARGGKGNMHDSFA